MSNFILRALRAEYSVRCAGVWRSLNLRQVDLYGEERNGSFDGLAGLLQRREIEVGVTSMFMRRDRLNVLHFSSETVSLL